MVTQLFANLEIMNLRVAIRAARIADGLPLPEVRRGIRIAAGVSQTTVAAEVGVTAQALSLWESGARRPRPENAARYAEALHLLAVALHDPLPTNDDGPAATGPLVMPADEARAHVKG